MKVCPEHGARLPKELQDLLDRHGARGEHFDEFIGLSDRAEQEDMVAAMSPHEASFFRMLRLVMIAMVEGGNREVVDFGRDRVAALWTMIDAAAVTLASMMFETASRREGDALDVEMRALRKLKGLVEARFVSSLRRAVKTYERAGRADDQEERGPWPR